MESTAAGGVLGGLDDGVSVVERHLRVLGESESDAGADGPEFLVVVGDFALLFGDVSEVGEGDELEAMLRPVLWVLLIELGVVALESGDEVFEERGTEFEGADEGVVAADF